MYNQISLPQEGWQSRSDSLRQEVACTKKMTPASSKKKQQIEKPLSWKSVMMTAQYGEDRPGSKTMLGDGEEWK